MQDQNLITQRFDQDEEMRREQKRGTRCGATPNGFFDVADAARIEAGQRLVQNDNARLTQKRASERELLQHTAREVRGDFVPFVGEFQFFEQGVVFFRGVFYAIGQCNEMEMLSNSEKIVRMDGVGYVSELMLRCDGRFFDIVSADANGAGGWPQDAGDGTQCSSFAGSV